MFLPLFSKRDTAFPQLLCCSSKSTLFFLFGFSSWLSTFSANVYLVKSNRSESFWLEWPLLWLFSCTCFETAILDIIMSSVYSKYLKNSSS